MDCAEGTGTASAIWSREMGPAQVGGDGLSGVRGYTNYRSLAHYLHKIILPEAYPLHPVQRARSSRETQTEPMQTTLVDLLVVGISRGR